MNASLEKIYQDLGINDGHRAACKLAPCEQPDLGELEVVDIHVDGRPFVLEKKAAQAWRKMRAAAASDQVVFEPFSGFRSYRHQQQLILRKLANGQALEAILAEVAIPGFSEHHSGRAVDICTVDRYQLDEAFEATVAFTWLSQNAARFGFRLSYPRGNPMGIVYEPWHWCFTG